MYIVPFESLFGCFRGVVDCVFGFFVPSYFLGLIWPFLLMTTWQPCSQAGHTQMLAAFPISVLHNTF